MIHSHSQKLLLFTLGLILIGCFSEDSEKSPNTTLEEASMAFDSEHVEPFLKKISPFFDSGFSEEQITKIVMEMKKLKIGRETELRFKPTYKGNPTTLKVGIFMDDVDAPDLYFYSTPELAEWLQNELESYGEEIGY